MARLDVEKIKSAKQRKHPVFADIDRLAETVRERAFQVFAERGSESGNELDNWLEAERQVRGPAAELVETEDRFQARVALPGFRSSETEVLATPREIIIKAARKQKANKKKKGKEKSITHFSEFGNSEVFRHFELPMEVEVDEVTATLKNGLLEIGAPKLGTIGKKSKKSKSKAEKKEHKKGKKKVKGK